MSIKKKQRSMQQIMEEESLPIVKQVLPKEWVIHEYKPDYGIDFVVEVFKYIDTNEEIAQTLGELFFVQLKSIKTTRTQTIKVYARRNIELGTLQEDKEDSQEVEVIPFQLETTELATVQAMGAGIPVLLLLVPLDMQPSKVFFVCLNDYVDKIILPQDPNYTDKGKKTIYIPLTNEITRDYANLIPLRFYAKRSKFYAAFVKFRFQLEALNLFRIGERDEKHDKEWKEITAHLINTLKRFDFWETTEMWSIIEPMYKAMLDIEKNLESNNNSEYLEFSILSFWRQLVNLGNIYEDICREWFLPTYLGILTSSFEDVE